MLDRTDVEGLTCPTNTGQCISLKGAEPTANHQIKIDLQKTYPNGNQITFTYNQSLDGWLMPEFQGLIDLGYTISNAHTFPSFNGQVLTLVGGVAALEPTFIGEIIFGGVVVVVTTIYVYDLVHYYFATVNDSTRDI
ncbi:hypothetical protein [Litoribacter populi]|uniref:hypothetical protein n=1 Tax=Litoribacter populi TaxID=2598460 RepID=UPI001180A6AB|nr:hypothetical protein [Litoribacter populi]